MARWTILEIEKYESLILQQDLINKGGQHLKHTTKNCGVFNPMSFMCGYEDLNLQVQNIFTKIKVVKGRSWGPQKDMDYEDLLTLAQGGTSQPQVVVVTSQAGGGKTTILNLVEKEWVDGGHGSIEDLYNYELLLRVQCRDSHLTSLNDLLENLMNPAYKKYGDFLPSLLKECCLLILVDGLDERNTNSHRLVHQLLGHFQQSPRCTFLCTTRHEALTDFIKVVPHKYVVTQVELDGIPVNLRPHFVKGYFREIMRVTNPCTPAPGGHPINELVNKVERTKTKEHFGNPLNMAFFTCLFYKEKEDAIKTTTQTELYHYTHGMCQEKLDERLLNNEQTMSISKLERQEKVEDVLQKLYLKELQGLKYDQLKMSEKDVKDLQSACFSHNLPEEQFMGAFLTIKISRDKIGRPVNSYSAPHKGLQDYYGSVHIVTTLETQPGSSIMAVMEAALGVGQVHLPKFQNVLKNVAGLLHITTTEHISDTTANEVVDLFHKAGVNNEDQWLDILEDLNTDPIILTKVASFFPDGVRVIKDDNIQAYTKIMPHLKQSVVNINIDSLSSIPDLHNIVNLTQHTYTGVEIRRHYRHPTTPGASDQFLQQLLLSRYVLWLPWVNKVTV